MMKRAFFILITVMSSVLVFSQTSDEEYQYVTYGYREQLQKGLDDKDGYYWKPVYEYRFEYQEDKFFGKNKFIGLFSFEALFRKDDSTPCAIVAIYRAKDHWPKKDGVFLCIPHHKSMKGVFSNTEKYMEEEVDFTDDVMFNYSIAAGRMAMAVSEWKK